MAKFGSRTTAEQVLKNIDLTGQTILLTGCTSGIGFETMRALAAHGAHIVGTGRSKARAAEACAKVDGRTTPIACDLDDFESVAQAARDIRATGETIDAIIANAGIMATPDPAPRYGVEQQMRVNHLSHMLLVTRLEDLLRDRTGRLVIISSNAAELAAPKYGIDFDNLDGHKKYARWTFYGQSKVANVCFAWTMAERLAPRGIMANAVHPGAIAGTNLFRSLSPFERIFLPLAVLFGKSIPQGAATQCYVAAHPDLAGVTGRFYADCKPGKTHPKASDPAFRKRVWDWSEAVLAKHAPAP